MNRFHRPVEGEEGYDPELFNSNKDLSSLAQIVSWAISTKSKRLTDRPLLQQCHSLNTQSHRQWV